MPTENWYPIQGASNNLPSGHDIWTTGGTTSVNKNSNTAVGGGRAGPATHDDDVSYITRIWSSGNEYQALNVNWPGPIVAFDGVLNGNMRHRVGESLNRGARFVNAAATTSTDTWANVTDANASYQNTGPGSMAASTGRPGGGSWTPADFQDDKTTFATVFITSTGQAVCTSIWGQISYTAAGGGFVFLLHLAGLGALPFVGRMDFSHFLRYLSWRRAHHPRRTILTGDEVRQAWDEIKAYRHPRFFMPAAV